MLELPPTSPLAARTVLDDDASRKHECRMTRSAVPTARMLALALTNADVTGARCGRPAHAADFSDLRMPQRHVHGRHLTFDMSGSFKAAKPA
jgi:hypothetical protein